MYTEPTGNELYAEVAAAGGKATIVRLAPQILRLTWKEGTTVEAADAYDVLERSASLVHKSPYAFVVNMHGISTMTASARDAFRADTRITACAMVGSTPMDQVLAAFSSRASHPTRYDASESSALRWITEKTPLIRH